MTASSIHERFTDAVGRMPDEIAVSAAGVALTYQEVHAAANRLGRRLKALGVGPETPVAVLTQRSTDVVV
ncbi:MAG TPA: AMP-binding protein, partial [Actinophytocola sp.]|nr:AMP-binding protein [Actinophytocola sp.]